VKLLYSRFLIFFYFDDGEGEQCLNWRAGLVFHWFNRLLEHGTPVPEHVEVFIYNELYSVVCIYCILSSALGG
jgi:hypothetical protein